MRYSASEKLEIIRTVETSPLPVRRTLAQIGIPNRPFTLGSIAMPPAGSKHSRIARLGPSASGTASPTRSARGSSHTRSTSRN